MMKIALLATGTEIIEGDILNTNGQRIAHMLAENGFTVGSHAMTSDAQIDIEKALQFLLTDHDVVIITGGLGPTSDDLTRYALAKVIQQELVFDEASWHHIGDRFKKIGLTVEPHPNNRQQALFPQQATIMLNQNGSANGCYVTYQNKLIFMLPGPPGECLPMFSSDVLPLLHKTHPQTERYKAQWRLIGVIESEIAALVDNAVKDHPITTGYRFDYPYLEVKIYANLQTTIDAVYASLNELLTPHLISTDNKTATELFLDFLIANKEIIYIEDNATRGWLAAAINTPQTYSTIKFIASSEQADKNSVFVKISGLEEFWQNQAPPIQSPVSVEIHTKNQKETILLVVPYRNALAPKYAVEFITHALIRQLKN